MQKIQLTWALCGLLLLAACESQPPVAPPSTPNAMVTPASGPSLADINSIIKKLTTLDGAQDVSAEMRMQVEDAAGKRAQLEFTLQRKFSTEQTATFIRVTAPREESDKAILAIEKNDAATEATSYLAGLKKLAKLKSDNYVTFREAKVTIQELLGMELAQYDFAPAERAPKSDFDNGVALIKSEGKAKANRNLAYPRLVVFFSEDKQEPVRFEVFDEKNELVKHATFDSLQTIGSKRMVSRVTFDDVAGKRKSVIETRSVKFDQNLSPKLFTEENLKGTISSASAKLTK
jgi:hypothetical protein